MTKEKFKILVIEDSETKWRDVRQVLLQTLLEPELIRASTIEEANHEVAKCCWAFVVLDISMDIKSSSAGRGAGGHDTTGGLKIAERMFYLGFDAPIIIVTAFDAFPSGSGQRGAVLGLQDIISEASSLLGDLFVGWVRYGDDDWEEGFAAKIQQALKK